MVVIDQSNAEELLFHDKKIKHLLTDLRFHFDQWHLAQTLPGLKNMGRRAILDLLSDIKPEHIKTLENYYRDVVEIHKIDYHIVANVGISMDKLSIELEHPFVGVAPYRTANNIELTFWR
jgi:hypothetical protein